MSVETECIEHAIAQGYYGENYAPRKCFKCQSLSMVEIDSDFYAGIPIERLVRCAKCGTELGYWVAGSWDSDYAEYVGELINRGEYE